MTLEDTLKIRCTRHSIQGIAHAQVAGRESVAWCRLRGHRLAPSSPHFIAVSNTRVAHRRKTFWTNRILPPGPALGLRPALHGCCRLHPLRLPPAGPYQHACVPAFPVPGTRETQEPKATAQQDKSPTRATSRQSLHTGPRLWPKGLCADSLRTKALCACQPSPKRIPIGPRDPVTWVPQPAGYPARGTGLVEASTETWRRLQTG